MLNLRNLSIQHKLSFIILAVSLLLLILISITLITYERIKLTQNMHTDLVALAKIMAYNTRIGLLYYDTETAKDTLASLRTKPNILVAHVFNSAGETFATYLREPPSPYPPEKHSEKIVSDENIPQHIRFYLHEGVNYSSAAQMDNVFMLDDDHADVFQQITHENSVIGTVYIQSDLREFDERLYWYIGIMFVIMLVSLIIALLLAMRLQQIITAPVYHLRDVIHTVIQRSDYSIRAEKKDNDEVGELIEGFNDMLVQIEQRDQEILSLNEQLKKENQRMGAELDVTRKLQQMVLPTAQELRAIADLDIAGFMEPADEVGGDYYDVLHHDGQTKIGIGDVTGHGLESGVVMLMVQMAVRTLLANQVTEPETFINVLNRAVFDNVQRMRSDKNLTFSLLDYQGGRLRFSGQHEEILLVRGDGSIERIDTIDLGFMVGLTPDIKDFVNQQEIDLAFGEGVVLYTDGVTEARNMDETLYGVERLCDVVSRNWLNHDADTIQQAVITDLREYIGEQHVLDDITLLVLKRVA